MTVYLVGAGPGDPGLLTVRAAEVLAQADVVVHDRLAESSLLDLAPPRARRVDVGKAPGGPVHQDQINNLLVEEGRAGRVVVRLKGGDPFVFGRGGEEALVLEAAGVAYEVVPGITSAIAVPAYGGVPVTHRGLATSFTVVTGHSRHAVDTDTNWEALAQVGGTIVVLMGVAHRDEIARRLIAGGLAVDTPVAAIHWGTRAEQRTLRVRLDGLGATELHPPVTLVVGAVAALDLGWFSSRPLLGRSVVIARTQAQAGLLAASLQRLGARTVVVPTIEIAPPADAGEALRRAAGDLENGRYDWVAFTSANAVEALMGCLRDARSFGRTSVAAIGPGTSRALEGVGVRPDLIPDRSVAEGLLESFRDPADGDRFVLLPQADRARATLASGLASAGWGVDVVEAYRTVTRELTPAERDAARGCDAIAFTSGSTVTGYLASAGDVAALPPVVVCIGPTTAAAAAAAGITVTAMADPHTLDGLVSALLEVLGR